LFWFWVITKIFVVLDVSDIAFGVGNFCGPIFVCERLIDISRYDHEDLNTIWIPRTSRQHVREDFVPRVCHDQLVRGSPVTVRSSMQFLDILSCIPTSSYYCVIGRWHIIGALTFESYWFRVTPNNMFFQTLVHLG